MRVDLFDFELPGERIALHPAEPRDSARMLVVDQSGVCHDQNVTDLVDLLKAGDVLVVNDTRVIPAELHGYRLRGENRANVSFNLHKRVDEATWKAFARPAKRLKPGDKIVFGETTDRACFACTLDATIVAVGEGGEATLQFELSGYWLDEAIKTHGALPLPPYIGTKRKVEERDAVDYQTVYAHRDGAVAAPTAGLHFTDELLNRLKKRGITIEIVTLHVGAGTFLPVKSDDTIDHKMHAEWIEIDAEVVNRLNAARAKGGRIVAVGTTSLRVLESAATEDGQIKPFVGDTSIFITPGYSFRAVDILMTNFHLPRSTLFMLVSAFCGLKTMHQAYAHAIENNYRFYSYGDASLLFRPPS